MTKTSDRPRAVQAVEAVGLVAFYAVLVWRMLDPEGARWAELRERVAAWRRDQRELAAQLDEIVALPEVEDACADS